MNYLLGLFALLKLTKLSKIFMSSLSILLTIFTYTTIYGFPFALGFVALIFFHEMGHYVAARQKNLEVGLPTFIPFVGAWIDLKEEPLSVEDEAYIAIAGPFVGTIASFICYYYGQLYGSDFALALAHSGFFLNLFNLIPFHPLDGGRIIAILSPIFWFFGIPILIIVWYFYSSPVLILIAICGIPSLQKAWELLQNPKNYPEYYNVRSEIKFEYGTLYIILVVVLASMMHYV